MTGIITFDAFDLPETPVFTLCNPNREKLYSLGGISERKYSARFTAFSEINFRADKYVDEVEMAYYDYITYRRLVYNEDLGYFMIVEVSEEGDGITLYKEVKCQSIESELLTKKINLFQETSIQFSYHELSTVSASATLMDTMIREYIPDWTYEVHDYATSGSLALRARTLDISDATVYNFLTTEVSQSYECIFVFDNKTKHIHVYEASMATTDTSIFISYDNVIKAMSVKESTDNLATCLTVLGGNGLDIREVNPVIGNKIYNFSYFLTLDEFGNGLWMSNDLLSAVVAWQGLLEATRIEFADLVTQIGDAYLAVQLAQDDLDAATTALSVAELALQTAIESGDSGLIASATADRDAAADDLVIKTAAYVEESAQLTVLELERTLLSSTLDIKANFTESQFVELQPFIVESSYIDENFSKLDSYTASEIQAESQKLYDQAIKALERVCVPRFTFTIDAVNLMMIKELQAIQEQVALGCTVTIEIEVGSYLTPTLLGYDLDFDDPTQFSITFGNRLHLDDDSFQYSELMNETFKAARRSQLNSARWNTNSSSLEEIATFITSPIDATNNNVISSDSREVVFDQTGIRVTNLSQPAQQIWLNNNLSFTEDAWATSKKALGAYYFSTANSELPTNLQNLLSGSSMGLVANSLVGYIIASDKLAIVNSSGSFIVTGSTIDITIITDNGLNTIYLNPVDGIKIMKNSSGSILSLDSNGDLRAIITP